MRKLLITRTIELLNKYGTFDSKSLRWIRIVKIYWSMAHQNDPKPFPKTNVKIDAYALEQFTDVQLLELFENVTRQYYAQM